MALTRKYREARDYPKRHTGSVAKWSGLSDEGIRLYERHGLIFPDKSGSSGYREFDVLDINMLLSAMNLRESGFSLKQTQALANRSDLRGLQNAYVQQADAIRKQLEWERLRLERIDEIRHDIEQIDCLQHCCVIEESPALYRVEYIAPSDRDVIGNRQKIVQKWFKNCLPFAASSSRFCRDMLFDTDKTVFGGLGVAEKYAALLEIEPCEHVVYYPPHLCIHTICSTSNHNLLPDFSYVEDFLRLHDLCVCGDAVSMNIASLHFNETFDRYFHLWIPVESPK